MKTRFLIGLTLLFGLSLTLSFQFEQLVPHDLGHILTTVSPSQNIAQALLGRGYSREDVAKIMGENLLRVFDEVVRTAKN